MLEPIGISNWINMGKKYGYDEYFLDHLIEIIKKPSELEKFKTNLLKNKKFKDYYNKKMNDKGCVFGRDFYLSRIKLGLTQTELAKELGIDVKIIKKIESK